MTQSHQTLRHIAQTFTILPKNYHLQGPFVTIESNVGTLTMVNIDLILDGADAGQTIITPVRENELVLVK